MRLDSPSLKLCRSFACKRTCVGSLRSLLDFQPISAVCFCFESLIPRQTQAQIQIPAGKLRHRKRAVGPKAVHSVSMLDTCKLRIYTELDNLTRSLMALASSIISSRESLILSLFGNPEVR